MATAPFTINTTTPGDTDIVSQFPGVDRTLRDIISSWMQVDHNTNPGGHNKLTLTAQSPDPTIAPGFVGFWAVADGSLFRRLGAGASEYVGPPPGSIIAFAGATAPNGYLICGGQAVSRATYATLFTLLGTTYGVGDGSTTFNVPDLRGRTGFGKDNMGGTPANRLTGVTGSILGTTLGAVGGEEVHTLLITEITAHTHSITDVSHVHVTSTPSFNGGTDYDVGGGGVDRGNISTTPAFTGITGTNSAGSSAAHNNVPPGIILNYIIKV